MVLPSIHVWIQGADKLVALHMARRRAQGIIPQEFLHVSQQVAENRIQAQGLIDAITMTVMLAALSLGIWLLSRWRTVRLPAGTAISLASLSLLMEMAFYAMLYVVAWIVLGDDAMRLSWNSLVPTDLSRLAPSGSLLRAILVSLTLGAGVRFVTLGLLLRRREPRLAGADVWIVAGGASLMVVVAGVLLQQI